MKTGIFLSMMFFLFLACTSHQSNQLTNQQKDQIISELKKVIDSSIPKWENADTTGYLNYYLDSPDFISINSDGSKSDYRAFKKEIIDQFNSSTSRSFSKYTVNFIVLNKNIVICTFLGEGSMTLKSGDKISFYPSTATMIYKKIDGQWKVTYIHESGTFTAQRIDKK